MGKMKPKSVSHKTCLKKQPTTFYVMVWKNCFDELNKRIIFAKDNKSALRRAKAIITKLRNELKHESPEDLKRPFDDPKACAFLIGLYCVETII